MGFPPPVCAMGGGLASSPRMSQHLESGPAGSSLFQPQVNSSKEGFRRSLHSTPFQVGSRDRRKQVCPTECTAANVSL